MAEITQIGRCQQLQQQIDNITAEITQNNTSIKDVEEKIKQTSSIANALSLSDRTSLKKELEKLKTKATELINKNTSLQNQLNALFAAFQQSGLQCVNKRFECNGSNDEILSIPLFIAQGPAVTFDTSILEAEKTKLENEREQKLQPINNCLDPETGVQPKIDELFQAGNGNIENILKNLTYGVAGGNALEFLRVLKTSLGEDCIKLVPAIAKVEEILRDNKSWAPIKNGFPVPNAKLKQATGANDKGIRKQTEIILLIKNTLVEELQKKKEDINKAYTPKIVKIEQEIEELSNSNSDFNKQSSNTIIDIIKTVKNQAPAPQIFSTTTVSAPGGVGLPVENPCSQTVTKTLGPDSKAVTFDANSYSIVLNPQRTILEFGPGGCEGENPIWIHPVNITTNNISVSNIENIKTFLLNELQKNKKYQEIEKRKSTSAPGIVTPINPFDIFTNFNLNDKVLRTCVDPPK
jgi:hypothetical protein